MKVKKLGHCCLLITTETATILTDPGTFTTEQDTLTGIDIVLISHEHQDHFHVDSVKRIILNNPNAVIISNSAVGKLLEAQGLPYELVAEGGRNDSHGVVIEGYGHLHAEIYKEIGQVENTGYFVDGKLFYPGDAFTDPHRSIEILALPIAGPWMKIHEAIEYTNFLRPQVVFPVHDGIWRSSGFMHTLIQKIFLGMGIEFRPMIESSEEEF